jgi:hypothetical protein
MWKALDRWLPGSKELTSETIEERIAYDDQGITRYLATGEVEHVAWDDLFLVELLADADRLSGMGFYFLLQSSDGRSCVVPQDAADQELTHRLLSLPGFDHRAVIEAVGTSESGKFTCWRRPQA